MPTLSGQQVPLSTVVSVRRDRSQCADAYNQLNSATFQAVPMPASRSGRRSTSWKQAKNLPSGYSGDYRIRQYVQEGSQLTNTFGLR